MHRLFVGIEIPDDICTQLTALQGGVPGARWRQKDHFHITLRFIGSVTKAQFKDIDLALSQIDAPAFELSLKELGHFGNARPRALWAGVEEEGNLTHLAQKTDACLQKLGFESEHRKYFPHVTLAYLKNAPIESVQDFITHNSPFESSSFIVDRFFLYESHLGKSQSQYIKRVEYTLLPAPWEEDEYQ